MMTADPVALARYLWGHDHWSTAQDIIRATIQPNSRVAVKACHSSSKTFCAADIVLLSLLMGGDVLTSAPTWQQVQTLLWGEIRRSIRSGAVPLSEWGRVNQTEIELSSGERAIGLSTDEGVRFQGWHARPGSFLQIILDEAPGVRPDIYEAIEGITAGGDVRILLLGNPVIASGPFYEVFASASSRWRRITIDAFETPNLDGLTPETLRGLSDEDLDIAPRPYLVTRRWVLDKLERWGEDHPLWASRVRGRFPPQSPDSLFSLDWLERAAVRPVEDDDGLPVMAGIDVAGPGEAETVVYVRQGANILDGRAFSNSDARGAVRQVLRDWRGRLESVNVDSAGIGHYFALDLEDDGYPVRRINVGEAPVESSPRPKRSRDRREPSQQLTAAERYYNLRAQVWWTLREWAQSETLAGLTDRTTIAQLASVQYKPDSRGRIIIEKKEDARKRGVESPDRAEALALAFWRSPKAPGHGVIAGAMSRAARPGGARIPGPQHAPPSRQDDGLPRRRVSIMGGQRAWP